VDATATIQGRADVKRIRMGAVSEHQGAYRIACSPSLRSRGNRRSHGNKGRRLAERKGKTNQRGLAKGGGLSGAIGRTK